MKNFKGPAPQLSQDRRTLLARILDTPHLERVVPRLQPELLHRVIQRCGLEDCGELVALATPEQITRIFDLDLWRPAHAGMDEQFDAARFGVWLEVLVEFGADTTAAVAAPATFTKSLRETSSPLGLSSLFMPSVLMANLFYMK